VVRQPLTEEEFDWIFRRVPRLTVEVVIGSPEQGVLLSLREIEPCRGMWHLPGGTVRFGEPLVEAVKRVADDELGVVVSVGSLLGAIEYPSHYDNGLDSPVGLAFAAEITSAGTMSDGCRYFTALPDEMHDEQRRFLIEHRLGRDAETPIGHMRDRDQPARGRRAIDIVPGDSVRYR
jgi:ADP-ribose pyrophosphatase YjhB (NUDIX family)